MPLELPFTITLDEFSLESYPPRLAIYDLRGGSLSHHTLSLADMSQGTLGRFDISVEEFLDEAIPSADGFLRSAEEGSAPAVHLAVSTPSGDVLRGWVTSGSFRFEPQSLALTPHEAVVMLPADPKRYLSRLTVTEQGGVAEGMVGIAKNENYEKLVPEEIRKELEDLEAKITAGEIEISTNIGAETSLIEDAKTRIKP